MTKKQQIRENFRTTVFKRDGFKCKKCGTDGKQWPNVLLDAHHITDRTKMPKGGYVKENGITLCPVCHLKAEKFHITSGKEWDEGFHPDDLYKLIGSYKELAIQKSNIIL